MMLMVTLLSLMTTAYCEEVFLRTRYAPLLLPSTFFSHSDLLIDPTYLGVEVVVMGECGVADARARRHARRLVMHGVHNEWAPAGFSPVVCVRACACAERQGGGVGWGQPTAFKHLPELP